MAADKDDLVQKVGLATATTLSAPGYTVGDPTVNVGATAEWPTDTGITFAIDTVSIINGKEVQDEGSYNEYVGVVTGPTQISDVEWADGSGDMNYAAGATTRVYIPVTKTRENRLAEALLGIINQDGTLKADAVHSASVLANDVVTTPKILDANVTTSKIADSNVTAEKLSTSAIKLGYAQVTSSIASTSSMSAVAQAGLSATVTVPPGGRSVKITAYISRLNTSTAPKYSYLSLWDGAVGSGTQISEASVLVSTAGGQGTAATVMAVATPSPGSKTYSVGLAADGSSSSQIVASASAIAFILVELI